MAPSAAGGQPRRHAASTSCRGFDASISVFRRDADTGALTPGGCVSDTGSDGRCVNGTALRSVSDVGVSPGRRLGVRDRPAACALTSYARDRDTGELTPRACVLGTHAGRQRLRRRPAAGRRPRPDRRARRAGDRGRQQQLGDLGPQGRRSLPVACYVHQDPTADDSEDDERGRGRRRGRGTDDEEADDEDEEEEEEEPEPANPDVAKCKPVKAIQNVLRARRLAATARRLFTELGLRLRRGVQPRSGHRRAERVRLPRVRPVLQAPAATQRPVGLRRARRPPPTGAASTRRSTTALAVFSAAVAVTNRTAKLSRSGRIGVRLACPAQRRGRAAGLGRRRRATASPAARRRPCRCGCRGGCGRRSRGTAGCRCA